MFVYITNASQHLSMLFSIYQCFSAFINAFQHLSMLFSIFNAFQHLSMLFSIYQRFSAFSKSVLRTAQTGHRNRHVLPSQTSARQPCAGIWSWQIVRCWLGWYHIEEGTGWGFVRKCFQAGMQPCWSYLGNPAVIWPSRNCETCEAKVLAVGIFEHGAREDLQAALIGPPWSSRATDLDLGAWARLWLKFWKDWKLAGSGPLGWLLSCSKISCRLFRQVRLDGQLIDWQSRINCLKEFPTWKKHNFKLCNMLNCWTMHACKQFLSQSPSQPHFESQERTIGPEASGILSRKQRKQLKSLLSAEKLSTQLRSCQICTGLTSFTQFNEWSQPSVSGFKACGLIPILIFGS